MMRWSTDKCMVHTRDDLMYVKKKGDNGLLCFVQVKIPGDGKCRIHRDLKQQAINLLTHQQFSTRVC